MRTTKTALAAATLLLLLSACGFRPAGSQPLVEPLRVVQVDVHMPYRVSEPAIEASLRSLLQRRGAELVEHQKAGVTLLRLSDIQEDREVLSVGIDGKALEYLLTTRVSYEVLRDGQILFAEDNLTLTRDYSFDAEQVLAKESEEARLREFMQNELAQLLLFRIEARLAQGPRSIATP